MQRQRVSTDWILIAKGIGIILVVVGHFDPVPSPPDWLLCRDVIYSFHMPLFFILSGYLYLHGKYAYGELIHKKTKRLLYPFLSIALAFGVIKYLAEQFTALENPVTPGSVVNVIVDPINSYAPLLWFLQALFLIFCLYPLLRRHLRDAWILLIFVGLNELVGSRYPVLGRVVANTPFFACGVILREMSVTSKFERLGARRRLMAAAAVVTAFGSSVALQVLAPHQLLRQYVVQFALALIGTLLVFIVSVQLQQFAEHNPLRQALLLTGGYAMTIYFFHSLFEGAVRIGVLQLARLDALPFLCVALAAIVAGIAGPMLCEKFAIRKSALARRLILGTE